MTEPPHEPDGSDSVYTYGGTAPAVPLPPPPPADIHDDPWTPGGIRDSSWTDPEAAEAARPIAEALSGEEGVSRGSVMPPPISGDPWSSSISKRSTNGDKSS
jgi:hypothetical protein